MTPNTAGTAESLKRFDEVVANAELIGPAHSVLHEYLKRIADATDIFRPLLLMGPPGTGKSEIARRLQEAVRKKSVNMMDEFYNASTLFSKNVESWIAQARDSTQSMGYGLQNRFIIVDDIEKVGKHRVQLFEKLRVVFDEFRKVNEKAVASPDSGQRWFMVVTTNLCESDALIRLLAQRGDALAQRMAVRHIGFPDRASQIRYFSSDAFKEFGFSTQALKNATRSGSMRRARDYLRDLLERGDSAHEQPVCARSFLDEINERMAGVLREFTAEVAADPHVSDPLLHEVVEAIEGAFARVIERSAELNRANEEQIPIGKTNPDGPQALQFDQIELGGTVSETDTSDVEYTRHEDTASWAAATLSFWRELALSPAEVLANRAVTKRKALGQADGMRVSARTAAEGRYRPQIHTAILKLLGLPSFGMECEVDFGAVMVLRRGNLYISKFRGAQLDDSKLPKFRSVPKGREPKPRKVRLNRLIVPDGLDTGSLSLGTDAATVSQLSLQFEDADKQNIKYEVSVDEYLEMARGSANIDESGTETGTPAGEPVSGPARSS